MILLNILAWLLLLYGITGVLLSLLTLYKDVPAESSDRYGQKTKREAFKVKLPGRIPAGIIGLVALIFLSCIVKIGPQDVGVLSTPRGVKDTELHTGWHFILPWYSVHKMDKTVWVYSCAKTTRDGEKSHDNEIWAPTKDGIKMGFDVSISWRIDPNEAAWVYQNVTEQDGTDGKYHWLERNVISTKLKSALALVVSEYNPIEAYSTKREEIQRKTEAKIRKEVEPYHLIIDNLDLREVYYNPDYEKAINQKKLAEQEALRLIEVTKQKEELLKQSTINKDIAIQQAQGEAEALKIKGSSIASNPKIIDLEWINKWNGQLPTYMMGNGQGVIMNLGK